MKSGKVAIAIAVAAALICATGWFHVHQLLREARQVFLADTLDPISEMLKENAALTQELPAASLGFDRQELERCGHSL